MRDSLEEKLTNQCRKAIYKHPFWKLPITLYYMIAMSLIKLVRMLQSNAKRLASIVVLCVCYIFSCSFCAPVLVMTTVAIEETTVEDDAESDFYDTYGASILEEMSEESDESLEASEALLAESDGYLHEENIPTTDEQFSIDDLLSYVAEETDGATEETTDANETTEFHKDDWNLLLINKQHPIPEDYEFNLGVITGSFKCDERIIPDLLEMLKQAKEDGISLVICSPYRSFARQTELFERKISSYMKKGYSYLDAYKLSSQAVTIPGASEHQVGLAIDIYTDDYKVLDASFGDTEAGQWLKAHCAEYGFILRYPEGKESITGIEFEPWHFRFVGKAAAKIIMDEGITLEEFIESL
ncbi:MAG: M15 family metallopeptidase [Lachnospiraceae bacterium]|nr:M15 family metallopeptidase [Lachnospiraceae bacterium]